MNCRYEVIARYIDVTDLRKVVWYLVLDHLTGRKAALKTEQLSRLVDEKLVEP